MVGKRSIPKYQPIKGGDRIVFDSETRSMLVKLSSDNIIHNENDKTITIKTKTQPFKYINVYKCLLKIALTILPENEIQYFEESFRYLNNEGIANFSLPVNITNTGNLGINHIEFYLYKKKNDFASPYMLFVMRFKNTIMQTFLHLNKIDMDKQLTTYYLKDIINANHEGATRITIDMNNDKTVTDEDSTTFSYQSSKELPDEILDKI